MIELDGVKCWALIASGSVVSSISEGFYNQHCTQIPLQDVDMHEGGRCLSIDVLGGGGFLLLGHLNLLKLHRKYSIFDSYWKNFEALQTTAPSGRFWEVLSLL